MTRKVLSKQLSPLFAFGLTAVMVATAAGQDGPRVIRHVELYNQPGRFAGWPANNGIWSWGDEIVVGFTLGYHKQKSGHTIDPDRPSGPRQARSLDGGLTWTIERPSYVGEDDTQPEATVFSGSVDFTAPDFAARFRDGRFYYSLDRCHAWQGPFALPTFGRPGLLARTDYIVEGRDRLTAFVAAEKESGGEGQPLAIRTVDGGKTWKLLGWIGRQPPDGYDYAIMPASVALKGASYLSMIRRGGVFEGEKRWWLEAFVSPDDGRSWNMLDEPKIDNAGNPATLTRLKDGRIAMVYGWRHEPYGIRARISSDEGHFWSQETVLRDDGQSWDLGYPRTVQRADGNLVTAYYFNDDSQAERYIGATIWSAGKADAVCFGIPSRFSGKLSKAQERTVPKALHGAFWIESLRQIKATDLAERLERLTQVAEETHDGKRYVAVKDFRCVQFSEEVSGMMIVIERYHVLSE